MTFPARYPALVPPLADGMTVVTPPPSADQSSLYDVAIGGVEFVFSNTPDNPMVRETVPNEKDRIDQEQTPGEQTLTSWWIKSQDSFHGGAGQLQLEPAFPTDYDHIRFDQSKNVDVWTPGQVTRLPDVATVSTDSVAQLLGVAVSGADTVVYRTTTGAVKLVSAPTGSPSLSTFTGVSAVQSLATDGRWVYAVDAGFVWKLDPSAPSTATKIATLPSSGSGSVLGWVKARLMLGFNGGVYEVDVTSTSNPTLGATQLKYQHPTSGWTWRAFSTSSQAVLAAGDANGQSTITQFTLDTVAGAPVLTVAGEITTLPVGERVLSLIAVEGAYLVVGTTAGVRVGTYDTYTGAFKYGPIELGKTDPVIPANDLTTRGGYVYVAGSAYDEGGLLRVDLGTPTDQAGRYAWAADLVAPTSTVTAATAVCVLPVSNRIVFSIPATGVMVEGVGPGTGRESWIRTSRIRYGTSEPKLFKLGRVRGQFASGSVTVDAVTPAATTRVAQVGFVPTDPDEFRLPDGTSEWLQLKFTLSGAPTALTNYGVKSLPGTRRQLHLNYVLAITDSETTKSGQRARDLLSARDRLNALEALAASGDETILQEFTPDGVISTRVVVERVSFKQTGRPSPRSDIGGDATVLLRTVES